jgi:hypothetical protein
MSGREISSSYSLQAWKSSAASITLDIHKAVASECRHAPEPGERDAGSVLLHEFGAHITSGAPAGAAFDLDDRIPHLA